MTGKSAGYEIGIVSRDRVDVYCVIVPTLFLNSAPRMNKRVKYV